MVKKLIFALPKFSISSQPSAPDITAHNVVSNISDIEYSFFYQS